MFNSWRRYPRHKPKNEDWYLCTTDDGQVLDLYFWFAPDRGGVWVDSRRRQVFLGYKVYKSGKEPLEYNRVYEDSLCERIDIVAWKKLPKGYRFRKENKNEYFI